MEVNMLLVFQGRQMKGGFRYPAVNVKLLSISEKMWLANFIINEREKSSLGYNNNKNGVNQVAKRYKIAATTLKQWVKRTLQGHILHESKGRPTAIDDIALATLKENVEENVKFKSAYSESKIIKKINELANET
jgi:transposase-like protein